MSTEVNTEKFENLWLDSVNLTGRAGAHIKDAFMEAWNLARDQKVNVELEFNGTKVTIKGRGY